LVSPDFRGNPMRDKWVKNNNDKICKIRRNSYIKKRIELINLMGGKCVICGFSDYRALQIDHINGGGSNEINRCKNTNKYYQDIKNLSNEERNKKYQLLCANCNWIKRTEENENANMNGGKE
jgi:hypothetical protein